MVSSFLLYSRFILKEMYYVSKSRENVHNKAVNIQSFFLDGRFLKGASSIDQHFQSTPFEKNIPVSVLF